MALTEEQTTLYTKRLAEAEEALHQLNMGTMARTFVDQNGERVEFAVANRGALRAYVFELQVKLGVVAVSGPMKVSML